MKKFVLAAVIAAIAVPASGQSLDSLNVASELGSVLGSEDACGLTFDQAAIAQFIEDKVAADDMSFASMLQTMTGGQERKLANLSASAKTAHCTQIGRVAKSFNFTK